MSRRSAGRGTGWIAGPAVRPGRPVARDGRRRHCAGVRSLRARLFVVWLLSLAAACAVGWLLVQMYRQSTSAQVARAAAAVAQACDRIADGYAFYATGWAGPRGGVADERLKRDLATLAQVALSASRGVEGGVWQQDAGSLAYAFPTYAGTGPRSDLPQAERPRIAAVNAEAAQTERPAGAQASADGETLVLHACPLPGPVPELTGWAMARVIAAAGLDALRLGLGVLLALVLGIAAWLTWLVLAWTRHVGRIEAALEAILTQIARLDRLIAELLAMTQRRAPQPKRVDLPALLEAAAADHRDGHATLAVEAEALAPMLDPALLRRALDALLDNAARHTPPGGRIVLRARRTGGGLRIEVADSGPGVPADLRDAVFEPFVTGRADGTGLGLAIARELVEAQGGRLTLAVAGGGAAGQGAVFAMELPREPGCRPS